MTDPKLTDDERETLYGNALGLDNLHAAWGRETLESAVERILSARLASHEARVTMLAAKFTRYAEEVAALPPVGATGRLDAMDRRESAVWARAAGMVLAVLDEASA